MAGWAVVKKSLVVALQQAPAAAARAAAGERVAGLVGGWPAAPSVQARVPEVAMTAVTAAVGWELAGTARWQGGSATVEGSAAG